MTVVEIGQRHPFTSSKANRLYVHAWLHDVMVMAARPGARGGLEEAGTRALWTIRANWQYEAGLSSTSVGPEYESLTMYGQPSDLPPLAWSWVEAELAKAGSYWVTARGAGHPHPRPVWGVWGHRQLHLSIGSPVVSRLLADDAAVSVHLGSDVDVVIIEGHVAGFAEASGPYEAYNDKYDWDYTIEEYGPLTTVTPRKVLAWRSIGWAGRDGFQQTGRWQLQDPKQRAATAR